MIIVYERGEKEKIKNGDTKFSLKTIYMDDEDSETMDAKEKLALIMANEKFKTICVADKINFGRNKKR